MMTVTGMKEVANWAASPLASPAMHGAAGAAPAPVVKPPSGTPPIRYRRRHRHDHSGATDHIRDTAATRTAMKAGTASAGCLGSRGGKRQRGGCRNQKY